MSTSIRVTRPNQEPRDRTFKNRREAAKFGVAYYLADNGYADRKAATRAAATYEKTGSAEHDGITFEEVTA